MNSEVSLKFKVIDEGSSETIALVGINRPDAANAFNEDVINHLKQSFEKVDTDPHCRAMVLFGHGRHFSAGADLGWMQGAAKMSFKDNQGSASNMKDMFEALNSMTKPTLCLVKGAAFGGAVGLAAAADVCLAYKDARFCLSEVRLGILPAVIFPYLSRKIQAGQLRRLSLTAKVFDGIEAERFGLVQEVVTSENVSEKLQAELNGFLLGGPEAQARLKKLLSDLELTPAQSNATVQQISEARVGDEAKAGFEAFFAKKNTPWKQELPSEWKIDD